MKKKHLKDDFKDICLHCAFYRFAMKKWGDKRDSEEAFEDIIHAAEAIAAEALANLEDEGKMSFLRNVMARAAVIEGDQTSMTAH